MPIPLLHVIVPAKYCKVCGTELKGRRDKKYCNLECKNEYHRNMRAINKDEVAIDVNILLRNRTILKELLDQRGEKKIKVKRSIMQKMGFQFQNFTGNYVNNKDKTYFYVFDYSWMPFSEQEIMILKRRT